MSEGSGQSIVKAGNAPIPGVKKIAVLRANALGDFIVALPALESLHAAYPDSELIYLGKNWHSDFLQNRPGPVDRVIDVPVSKGVNIHVALHDDVEEDPKELDRFFERMQRECFDLAIQLHGGGRYSNPFLLRLGARLTAGMKTSDAPALDYWMPYDYWQHETFRLLEAVRLVGADPVTYIPRLAVTGFDIRSSLNIVPESEKPIAILHPGASDPRRRWSPTHFARVGDALALSGARVIITGVAQEQSLTEQVVEEMSAPALNVCGKLNLQALTGLLARATVVVSNDTGPRHLAAAVGTPTVGIYWCGNLINAGPVTRTDHRPFISWQLECPICGVNTLKSNCDHQASFVDEIRPEEVILDVLDLFSRSGKNRG
jgi:ADP-heptose:LPS heptosyltransferase